MKAVFNRNGATVNPKIAALFVNIGAAKYVDEPEISESKPKESKVTVEEQPEVPKQEDKPKGKRKGRPVKV